MDTDAIGAEPKFSVPSSADRRLFDSSKKSVTSSSGAGRKAVNLQNAPDDFDKESNVGLGE